MNVVEPIIFALVVYVGIPLIYHYIVGFVLKIFSKYTDINTDEVAEADIFFIYVVIFLLVKFSSLAAYLNFALVPIIVSVILIALAMYNNSKE